MAITWERVTAGDDFARAIVNDATYGNGIWVAVGNVQSEDSVDAAIWTSASGREWKRTDTDDSFANRTLMSVTNFGEGFAATGTLCGALEGCAGGGEVYATTADGNSWVQHPLPADQCCVMESITAGGPGLVSAGFDYTGGYPREPADAAIGLSSDGATWTHVRGTNEFDNAALGEVISLGDVLIASGSVRLTPQIWVSTDATTWNLGSEPDRMGSGQIMRLASNGDLVIGVGRTDGDAGAWIADSAGEGWAAGASPGQGSAVALAVSRQLFVAGGEDNNGAAIWVTSDGTSWTQTLPIEVAEGGEVKVLVTDDSGRVTAFGTAGGSVVLWLGTQR